MTDDAATTEEEHPYRMRLSLNVLDHLGLNLYSNIPAVLSEVVANSWDADARTVTIEIDTAAKKITVTDTGVGMTADDLNDRFLFVGYRRREKEPTTTAKGRHVMGRKGIGKLSLFAIAKTVRLETVKGGVAAGFILRTDAIREQMTSDEGEYHPEPLEPADVSVTVGTKITLTDLRVSPTAATVVALRRRLARRFSIIGPEFDFKVDVDGNKISVTDRDFYPKIEYLWSLGDVGDKYEKLCKNAKKANRLSGVVDAAEGWEITGWVGTVDEQKSIDEETNVVPVLAWGKLIHEDLLTAVKPAGVFAKYMMGELHADFVDQDGLDDIATSDRQSLKEIDPRYEKLRTYLEDVLRTVGNSWRDWRRDDALDKARKNPIVEEWYTSLKGDAKKFAKQLFSKIGDIPLTNESDRIELYKNGILAFEKLRLRDLLSEVEKLEGTDLHTGLLGQVFASIDEIEAAQYGEIARGRVSVITSLVGLVDADAKEDQIKLHLFDHLWLLDTSWERASTNERVEQGVMAEFAKLDAKLTPEEKAARIDIRYRTAAGKNIIIELKRYGVVAKTSDLVAQIGKYRNALQKCLKTKFPEEPQQIECIAVLGTMPSDLDPAAVAKTLAGIDARVVTFDDLIASALRSYQDYLEKHKEVSKLADLIVRLEASGTTPAEES